MKRLDRASLKRKLRLQVRISADDLSVEHGGESDPGRIWDERICGRAVHFTSGCDVGNDRAFEGKNVNQCERFLVLPEE